MRNAHLDKEMHELDFLSFDERDDILAFLNSLTSKMPENLGPPADLAKPATQAATSVRTCRVVVADDGGGEALTSYGSPPLAGRPTRFSSSLESDAGSVGGRCRLDVVVLQHADGAVHF